MSWRGSTLRMARLEDTADGNCGTCCLCGMGPTGLPPNSGLKCRNPVEPESQSLFHPCLIRTPTLKRQIGETFARTIARDLTLSGLFRVLDRRAYIEGPEGFVLDHINFQNWSVLDALALVKGGFWLARRTVDYRGAPVRCDPAETAWRQTIYRTQT